MYENIQQILEHPLPLLIIVLNLIFIEHLFGFFCKTTIAAFYYKD